MAGLIDGRAAIVTGAASGLGRAFALALAEQGGRIVVADANLRGAEATAATIGERGGEALALAVDVRSAEQARAVVEQTVGAYGQVDVLVHSAGVDARVPFLEMSEDEWDRVLDINLKGTFVCCQAVLRAMLPRGRGSIITVASSRGLYGQPRGSHYSASKGGVVALTKSLALEFADRGIRINTIMPGRTDTPLSRQHYTAEQWAEIARQGDVGQPEDVVGLVVFLASDLSAAVTGEIVKREIWVRPGT